ncbi:MAG: hypothetical protein ABJN62_19370 [Halioglobus sp.]
MPLYQICTAIICVALLLPSGAMAAKPASEWYLATRIEATTTDQNSTTIPAANPLVIGQRAASSDGRDNYDVPPFQSLANSKVAAVFIQTDWGEYAGEYLSDYHDNRGNSDTWVFTVFSSLPEAQIRLSWDGLVELKQRSSGRGYDETPTLSSRTLKDLKLIDLETLTMVDAVSDGQPNEYTFTLPRGVDSRSFRWVLGPVKGKYFKPASGAKQYIKAQQKTQKKAISSTPDNS